jgi:hypothetical protein
MLRRKLELKMDDLKELRVKPLQTWYTSRSHKARAKTSRTRITTSQSKILPSKKKNKKDDGCFMRNQVVNSLV